MQKSGRRSGQRVGNRTPGKSREFGQHRIGGNDRIAGGMQTTQDWPETVLTTENRGVASSILALAT
jgi:hypothetical protein